MRNDKSKNSNGETLRMNFHSISAYVFLFHKIFLLNRRTHVNYSSFKQKVEKSKTGQKKEAKLSAKTPQIVDLPTHTHEWKRWKNGLQDQ